VSNYLKGGNGYLIMQRDTEGNVKGYVNRKWNEMYPFYDIEDNIWYYDHKTKRAFWWYDVLHLADITDDALVGKTKVSHQAETLGISKAARTFVNKFYDKGLFLGAVVEYPETINLDDETSRAIETTMNQVYGGVEKLTGVGVIDSGGKLKQLKMDMPLKDAAYIEQEVRTDEAIDSFFAMPTEMKTQDDSNRYYNDCIMPIIRMIEEEVALKVPVMADQGKYYLKFEVDSILRAAPETKINVLTKSIDKGLMTINEGREKMELPPIPGGDQTLVMANNLVPLAELEEFVKSKM
jgi:HK97 family phage portal protein